MSTAIIDALKHKMCGDLSVCSICINDAMSFNDACTYMQCSQLHNIVRILPSVI